MVAEFQSTHPCGVRRSCRGRRLHAVLVSIHAPLRGATSSRSTSWAWWRSFNPRTPAWCDYDVAYRMVNFQVFQSTHPCGVRLDQTEWIEEECGVSIHAPLRGATRGSSTTRSASRRFNPRTPAGCDFFCLDEDKLVIVSIHAPLRGATVMPILALTNWSFNPRTPAGCDSTRRNGLKKSAEFQSTHPCGVRLTIR